jgi:hypothetical protein
MLKRAFGSNLCLMAIPVRKEKREIATYKVKKRAFSNMESALFQCSQAEHGTTVRTVPVNVHI